MSKYTLTKVTLPDTHRNKNDRILGIVFTDGEAEVRNIGESKIEFFKKYINATVGEPVETEDKEPESEPEVAEEKPAETKEAPDAKKVPAAKRAAN